MKWDRALLYGWMLGLSVILYLALTSQQHSIQHQRRTATIFSCERQDRKHAILFREIREQRERNKAELRGSALVAAERQQRDRETLLATLEPWEDCAAKARLFVH